MRMISAIIFFLLATVAGAGYSTAHQIPGERAPGGFLHPQNNNARADNTDPTDEPQVKALVAHWLYHIAAAVGPRGAQDLVEFRRYALGETDRGTWTSDRMSMDLLDSDWNVIYSLQPYNEELQSYGAEGRNIRDYRDAKGKEIILDPNVGLQAVREGRQQTLPDSGVDLGDDFTDYVDCVSYNPTANEPSPRHMCSTTLFNPYIHVVAGLDIEPGSLPKTEESTSSVSLRERTTAQDVLENNDRETLKEFVDAVASLYAGLVGTGPLGLAEIVKLQIEHKTISSPWRAGNIYLFIMTDQGSVLFNALDRSLEGAGLDVTDQEGNNIWQLIQETLARGVEGEGFFEYLWDNPDKDGDEVRGPDGLPVAGKVPGTSRKIGYVKRVDTSSVGLGTLIIGSGIYPEGRGDDGCSISGPGTTLGSGLLNLFLVVSVLLSAVLRENRIAFGRTKHLD